MALWENLSKKATNTTAKAVHQAKVFSETTRINGLISEEEKRINEKYSQIGKLFVEVYRDGCDEQFADLMGAVLEAENKIKDYRLQIQNLKGETQCKQCGAILQKEALFCSNCGWAVPKPEPAASSEKCAHCGNVVEKGMRFCTSCGKPIEAASAEEELVQVEETPVAQELSDVEVVEQTAEVENAPQLDVAEEKTCPNCGAKREENMRFCTECGTRIE